MKKFLQMQKGLLALLLAFGLGMGTAYAYDFSATCSTGQTLYYNIIDATNHYVEITYPGTDYGNSSWNGYTKPTGNIALPSTVTDNGIPYTVTRIGDYTFYECSGLTGQLTIPNSVNTLDRCAFYGCSGFTGSLIIGNSVTSIGEFAFGMCTGLTGSLTIGNSVTTIGKQAFRNCSGFTGSLTIGSAVTSIGNQAFNGLCHLTSMTVLPETPPTLGDAVFFDGPGYSCPVFVPYASLEAYQTYDNGEPWGGYGNLHPLPYDDFPYVNDFETSCGWRLINGDLTNQWVWGEAGTRNNHYLYISNNNGTSNQYTITSPTMVYATKLFHFEEGWYRFQYDWLAYGEKNYDYLRVALVPASVELSAGTSVPSGFSYQALPEGWIALDGGQQLGLNSWWQTFYSEIDVPTGDYYMVFAWRNDNSVGTQPPAAIDNVSIRPITCLAPTDLTAQYVGATKVTLGWTPSGDEDEWRVTLSWTNGDETYYVPYPATTNPFTLTGLTAGRTYTAIVCAVCDPDNVSFSSNEISFTTSTNLCDDPITFPFTENFDGYTGSTSPSVNVLPDCWSRINTTTASYYSGYPRVTEFSSYAHSGPNFLYFMSNYDSDPQDQYAILPPMDNVANLVLSLYARIPASGRNGTFMVGVMTDPTDASTFTEVASLQPTSTTYTYYSIPLGLYMGDGTYIAIKLPAASSEVLYRGMCIDDVSVTENTCEPPTGLTVTDILSDRATFTWDAEEGATWQFVARPAGESPDNWATNTNNYTVWDHLSPDTDYVFYLRRKCSNTEFSVPVTVSFHTTCIDIPYTENFDGYTGTTSGSVNILPNCWSRINTTTASNFTGYPSIFEYNSYAHSGNNFLFFMSNYNNGDDPQDQYVILPNMESVNGLVLSLYARAVASNRVAYFEVGVMTDPTNASTFTSVVNFTPSSTTYEQYTIKFSIYLGQATYIAIKMPAASTDTPYRGFCIDDVSVTEATPFCNPEDQCELTFTLTDSYGDTWNGNAICVVDVATGTVLATVTNATNDHANAPITETYTLPVCDGRELSFEWVMGSYPGECSYTITDANGAVILQGTGSSSMNTGDVLGTYTVNCSPFPTFITDGNWNDANLWNTGMVPPAGSDVVIQANVTVPAGYIAVANEVTLDGGSITVADGGQLKHNTLDLMVTMKKNIAGYDDANSQNNYYLLAVPFLSVQVPAAMTANPGSDFYRFDPSETGAEWRNHKQEPITFVQRRYGYLYANPESVELSLTGITLSVSNEFTMSYTVDYTEGSGNPSNGWALLGNPFTYNAYVYRFGSNNEFVPMPIMMYDEEGELQTICGGPVAPMQGFFVHVTETTTVYFSGTGLHEDDYVDLGLPSGTLWATCNVGANAPEDYGDYFAWGETQPKDTYSWSTYQYCNGSSTTITKYCTDADYGNNGFVDNLTTLLPEDDAATANWGNDWRMPTQAEWQELYNNTTVTMTTQNGVNGELFTAANGNSLFLPATGFRHSSSLSYASSIGFYRSSSLDIDFPEYAWHFIFESDGYGMSNSDRNYGLPVRPVHSGVVPEGAINGKFTINDEGSKVHFSQGNLQYQASTNTWKFADNQWDCLSISTGQNSANQDVDRDLFGWGTSGYDHGAVCYQPWSTSQTYSDYYAYEDGTYTAYDLNEQTGMADWGYNAISNGGNQTNQWRTLTEDEWMYVFNTRSTASGIRYAKATVNDVKGVILLPDNWSSSIYSLNNTNTANVNCSVNTISASQWTTLENAGAVFLPAAGYRDGTTVYHVGSRGYYWSATSYNNISAYDLDFSNQNFFANGYYSRSYGFSVRVVCSAE